MDELLVFFSKFGLPLTIIAITGIIALGIMKYCKVFTKIEEKTRHLLYVAISVGFSVITATVYLLCIKQFDITNLILFASSVYALNQAWYSIFKTTTLNELITDILSKIIELIKSKNSQ